jgi:hypothetical protein
MNEIEKELVEATGFDALREYRNRQDYLTELLIASADLKQDEFDALSEPAYEWTNNAAVARRSGKLLPDFDGGEYEDHSEHDPERITIDNSDTVSEPGDLVLLQGSTSSKVAPTKSKRAKKPKKEKYIQSTEVDKFGIRTDTKAHLAVKLMEAGCTMKDVQNATGSTHYNILGRLEKQGHKVHRDGHFIKVTAKSDVVS